MIKMIIATDRNFGIGISNSIPWDCPSDMKYFKEQTINSTVVMGRKTFESLNRKGGLPNRFNMVVSSSWKYGHGNVVSKPLESIISDICNPVFVDGDDIWVIGGSSIYQQLLPFVEEIHHTIIDGVYDCDTHFNMNFLEDWELVGGKDLCENAVVNIWRKSK